MTGEPRQPSYVDLSDGEDVRFAGECGICGARYASRPVAIAGSAGAALREMRKAALSQFDVAWRELQVSCYRCGRGACPECWDAESRMCVECADTRGLARAPYTPPTRGPLVDGRLVLTDRGKYSRVEQPAWVGNVIAAGQGSGRAVVEAAPGDVSHVPPWMLALTTSGDLAREVYPAAPFVPVPSGTLASEPTEQIPTAPNSQPLPPPVLPPEDTKFAYNAVSAPGGGASSAAMIACPRCGTLNYDFVTQCTACQLQLMQICPNCEKLNSGQATRCESCGTPLSRPRGWSGVLPPLSPDIIAAMKREARNSDSGNANPSGSRLVPIEQEGTVSTRIVPYAPSASGTPIAPPNYTPGGSAAAATVSPPPRERGKRRRQPTLTALAGSAVAMATPGQSALDQSALAPVPAGRLAKLGSIVDRLSGWILVLVVLGFVGMIAAAEVSPGANNAIRGIIHIDIRQTLAQFGSQMQMLWQRIHR